MSDNSLQIIRHHSLDTARKELDKQLAAAEQQGIEEGEKRLRERIVAALVDGHANDSAADMVANVSDVVGWESDEARDYRIHGSRGD